MKRDEAKAKLVRAGRGDVCRDVGVGGEGHPQPTLDEMAGKAALRQRQLKG